MWKIEGGIAYKTKEIHCSDGWVVNCLCILNNPSCPRNEWVKEYHYERVAFSKPNPFTCFAVSPEAYRDSPVGFKSYLLTHEPDISVDDKVILVGERKAVKRVVRWKNRQLVLRKRVDILWI